MKKVLVIGSKGMAGHMIRQTLIESNSFEVIDISRDASNFTSSYSLNLFSLSSLETILETERPDIIVNCAGILNEDAEANPEKSAFINSFMPHFFAKRCSKLIHISTDCVFSGRKGDYIESDEKDGQGVYAESKSLGEVLYAPHLTLRTSIIGPELKHNGIGLLDWFLNQNNSIKGYSKVFWSGVTTLQLAKAVLQFINKPEINGLVHYTNNTKINKLDLLRLMASIFKKNIMIDPFDNYHSDKSLINTRKDIILDIPDYEKMIKELFVYMELHKTGLYRKYYRQ